MIGFWTDRRIAILTQEWGRIRAADIAVLIEGTKDSVIGKANRMGLKSMKPVINPSERAAKRRAWQLADRRAKGVRPRRVRIAGSNRSTVSPSPPSYLPEPELPHPTGFEVDFSKREIGKCCWPLDYKGTDNLWKCCGAKRHGERPYCEYHADLGTTGFGKPRHPTATPLAGGG